MINELSIAGVELELGHQPIDDQVDNTHNLNSGRHFFQFYALQGNNGRIDRNMSESRRDK